MSKRVLFSSADESGEGANADSNGVDPKLFVDNTDRQVLENKDGNKDEEKKVFDADYVKELREEAARHRKEKQAERDKVADLEKRLKAFEDAQLTEEERRTKEVEELRNSNTQNLTRAQEAELKFQIALAASDPDQKIGDVKAAIKLMDRSTLEFDSEGNITNLQSALETLKKEYPSIVASTNKAPAPNVGTTNPSRVQNTKVTKESIKNMSMDQIYQMYEKGDLNDILKGNK